MHKYIPVLNWNVKPFEILLAIHHWVFAVLFSRPANCWETLSITYWITIVFISKLSGHFPLNLKLFWLWPWQLKEITELIDNWQRHWQCDDNILRSPDPTFVRECTFLTSSNFLLPSQISQTRQFPKPTFCRSTSLAVLLHHTWEYLICNQKLSCMMELAKTRIPQEYFQTLHSQVKISPWQYFPTLSTSTCNLPRAKIRFTGASRCRPSLHRFSPLLPFTVLLFSQPRPAAGDQCDV